MENGMVVMWITAKEGQAIRVCSQSDDPPHLYSLEPTMPPWQGQGVVTPDPAADLEPVHHPASCMQR